MAFVTTTSPDLYATTSNLEEIPAGADPLQYADDAKMNQILVGLTALHGWASGVPVGETANGHYLGLASGSSAAVSVAGGVRIRNDAGALDYSYNTGAYARLLSKLTLASQATGDIMYASAADTWTRLAAGTNGHVLTLSGGVPTWAAGGGGGGLSSPVGAADGGTGITSYAVGDLIYASGATTLSKLADVATGNVLLSGGVTTAPAWGQVGLTTHVSGTLPAANGGTGQAGGYAIGDMLYASGAAAISKLAAVATGQVLASAGVTTAPAYTANPTLTTLGLAAGSTAACSLYATGDPNTGVYFPAADQIAIVSGGSARVIIDGSTELHSLIQTGPAGSASLPTYGFTGDPNTGAYNIGADQYGITAGGTLRLTIDTGTITSTLPIMHSTGSAAAPSLTFNGDANTGLFSNGADTIGLATGGSMRMDLSTTAITMRLATMLAVGTVSAPGLAFDGDDDLGLYRVAANTLGISTGNFLKMELGDATKNVALRATTATTNATTRLETYEALCSGTAAVGFGAQMAVNAANAVGSQITQGTFDWAWTNAGAATETADLTIKLRTAGSTSTAAVLTSAGAWQVGAGSASLPSLTFTGDTNTGFYSSGADEISTTIGGTQRHKLGTSARWKFGAAALEDAYLFEVCTDAAGASNSMRSTSASGVAYYYAKADDVNAGAFFAHYGSSNADTFCGGSNTNSSWLKAIGGHLSIGTNTAAKNLYLGANNTEFIQCVAGGEIKFSQMFKTVAGNEQTTVGAAGGASALPATPTKYIKFKDSAGTTLIIPAYAAA